MLRGPVPALVLCDRKIQGCNRAAKRLLGLDITGQDLDAYLLSNTLDSLLSLGPDDVCLTGFQGHSGSLDVEVSVAPFFDEQPDGETQEGWVLFLRDMTARNRTQAALLRLVSVMEQAPYPIVELTQEGTLLFANESANRAFPSLWHVGSKHPATSGFDNAVALFRSGRALFVERELKVEGQVYQQRLCWFAETGTVRAFFFDATNLHATRDELVRASHQAGMAEVVAEVLHNLGNLLNSVNISASLLQTRLENSRVVRLHKALEVLDERADDLATYLTEDPRGKMHLFYLQTLCEAVRVEHKELLEESYTLLERVQRISHAITAQQRQTGTVVLREPYLLSALLDDAFAVVSASFRNSNVECSFSLEPFPEIVVERYRVVQILVHLLTNARDAVQNNADSKGRTVEVRVTKTPKQSFCIQVKDNGVGIAPEDQTRIFAPGFTTKAEGYGFGLHSASNAARAMNGHLICHSDGLGTGASFSLTLPLELAAQDPPSIG